MSRRSIFASGTLLTGLCLVGLGNQDTARAPRAFIDGTGEGWRTLEEKEFVKVNCKPDTFEWNG